jgi:TolB-like protein
MFVAALILAVSGVGAQALRIAVMDFTVESDDPQFKYLGKGFAELASVEVARLPGFTLVDRERRNALLEEQAFSLSGAADAKDSIAIGKLLTVDCLVVGTVLEMFGNLVVTFSVIKTESGEVVGKSSAEGAPGEYKRIIREIGNGIAKMSGKGPEVAAVQAPPVATAPPVEKQAEVLTSFSAAVEALDRKDVKTAKANLEKARKIDPTDPAVRLYLDKLGGGSSKFAVIPPVYYFLDNPASLGALKKDMLFFYGAGAGPFFFGEMNEEAEHPVIELDGLYGADMVGAGGVAGTYAVREIDGRMITGYALPLTPRLGFGAQLFFSRVENNVMRIEPYVEGSGWDGVNFYGTALSMGWSPTIRVSIGFSGTVGFTDGNGHDFGEEMYTYDPVFIYGGELGLIIKNAKGNFVFSMIGGINSDVVEFFNMRTITLDPQWDFQWPLYLDLSVAYVFKGRAVSRRRSRS